MLAKTRTRSGKPLGYSTVAGLVLYVVVWVVTIGPLIALFFHASSRSIERQLSRTGGVSPLTVSFTSSLIALAVVVLLGTPLAFGLARSKFPGTQVVRVSIQILLVIPPLVLGLLLVYLLGPYSLFGGVLGHLHLSATNTFFAVIIAEIYEAIPYYVLGAEAGFRSVDKSLEQAAGLLGASKLEVFRSITVPLSSGHLATALGFAWARAMGAFGAVIVVAYNPHNLPMAIYISLQDQGLGAAFGYAVIFVIVSLPVPLLAYGWARTRSKSLERDLGLEIHANVLY